MVLFFFCIIYLYFISSDFCSPNLFSPGGPREGGGTWPLIMPGVSASVLWGVQNIYPCVQARTLSSPEVSTLDYRSSGSVSNTVTISLTDKSVPLRRYAISVATV